MRQRLRHSQSSQSDEYLKTCLKEPGGVGSASVCASPNVCVSRTYVEGYLISLLCMLVYIEYTRTKMYVQDYMRSLLLQFAAFICWISAHPMCACARQHFVSEHSLLHTVCTEW